MSATAPAEAADEAAPAERADPQPVERRVSASDGLSLFVRDFAPEGDAAPLPVLCLPGLTRDSRDFEPLGRHFMTKARRRRRVVAMDFRGRGRSEHDPDGDNYSIGRELQDVLDVLAALDIAEAIIVGTSRGGLVLMQLAAVRPTAIAGGVLNDVGPEVGGRGLLKIKNALERTHAPKDWDEAAELLKDAYGSQFPKLKRQAWQDMARRTYIERDGRPVSAYDVQLLKALKRIDFSQKLPSMWPQFDALALRPVLAIRGGHSDLLEAETFEAMTARQPALRSHLVADSGHAPALASSAELRLLESFFNGIDKQR